MKVGEAVTVGAARLPQRAGIPDPRREARWLLAAAWGVSESWVLARPEHTLSSPVAERFFDWIARRAAGEPSEHLTGRCEFWGRELAVSPAVLVPRPETELLVQAVLELELPADARVLDVGTGSGAIALSLALARPGWRVSAVDRSLPALAVAARNVARYGAAVSLSAGDLGTAVAGSWHLVVANLPYIPTAELAALPVEVRHDPASALDGGADGLVVLRRLLAALPQQLAAEGWCALELGEEQADTVAVAAASLGLEERRRVRDLGGADRVLLLQRGGCVPC